jgi:hypothetical protein
VHSLLMMNFSVTGVFGEIPAVIKYVWHCGIGT